MRAGARIRCVGRAAAAALALASPSSGQIIVLDGMWVDDAFEKGRVPLTNASPALSTEAEEQQRIALANQFSRPARVTPRENELAGMYLLRAEAALRSGDLRQALQEARNGLALSPDHPALLSRAAVAAAGLKDYGRAEQFFARFLEQRPHDAQHLAGCAGVLLRLSRIEEAEALIRRGLEQNSDHMPLLFHDLTLRVLREAKELPTAYWRRRNLDELALVVNWLIADRAEYERMLGAPDYRRLCETVLGAGTVNYLMEIRRDVEQALGFLRQGQYAETRAALERVRHRGLNAYGVGAAVAQSFLSEGRVEEALRQWERLTEEFGDWPLAWLNRGYCLLRADRPEAAVSALLRALELAPDDALIRFSLACAFALSGSKAEAQVIFDQLIASNPEQFRAWMRSDPVLERAVLSVPKGPEYARFGESATKSE